MSHSEKPAFQTRLKQSVLIVWLPVRRFVFHQWLALRNSSPVMRSTLYEMSPETPEVAPQASSSRTHAVLPLSSSDVTDLNTERSMHADHSEAMVDQINSVEGTNPVETEGDLESSATYRVLEEEKRSSSREAALPRTATQTNIVATRATKDDEADRLTVLFGPPSRKRNLWMFVGSTGTVGLILALILLFSGTPPDDAQIHASTDVVEDETPDPFTEEPVKEVPVEKPEPDPPEEIKVINVVVEFLPPPPEKEQEPEFELTAKDRPEDPNAGFHLLASSDWQKATLLNDPHSDPWAQLQKLVPLEPFGPQEGVTTPDSGGVFTASFLTTQPRRGTQSLMMPYELTVTNNGPTKIDRLVMQQSLPKSVRLQDTSAVHAAENRTLRWEYEGLASREQWTIPMVVVPTQQGQVKIPTTLDVGQSTSSQTLVQTPDVKLEMVCEPAAQHKKYHQIVFTITNTGEVPLNSLIMDVGLTGNLWHRFGQEFEFVHKQLDVGQTRRALLHVKTAELGGAQLQASLITDEGAAAGSKCEFVVVANGAIESRAVTPPAETEPSKSLSTDEKDWRTREDRSEPKLVPDAPEGPFALPIGTPGRSREKPVEKPAMLETPAKETPVEKISPAEEFPDFPEFAPLPERRPLPERELPERNLPERKPAERKNEASEESPFEFPPKPNEQKPSDEKSEENPSDPIEEDPFVPRDDSPSDFFGDE